MLGSSRVLSTLFLLLWVGVEAQHRVALPKFTKHLPYGSNDLLIAYSIAEETIFAQAICIRRNDRDPRGGGLYKRCRLILESSAAKSPLNKASLTRTCDLKLQPEWAGGSVARSFKFVLFGDDSLVLVWREEIDYGRHKRYIPYPVRFTYRKDYLHVKVVHMDNCQSQEYSLVADQRDSIYEPKIQISSTDALENEEPSEIFAEDPKEIHNLNIVVNGDRTLDVFFRNGYLCGKQKRCRVTYDSRTNSFSDRPVPFLEVKYDATLEIHPIVSDRDPSNILAYAIQSLHLDDGAVTLLNPQGQKIYEHTYSWSPYNLEKGVSNVAMSTNEESFGFCQQPTKEALIRCSLFDSAARGLIGVDIALKSADVALIRMRNHLDGGFLLLIGYGNATTSNAFEALDVIRVDVMGELAHVYSADNYKCAHDESAVDVAFVDKDARQTCYYIACSWPIPKANVEERQLQLFGECYSERRTAHLRQ